MKCEHCGRPFSTWDAYRRHVNGKHGGKLPEIEPPITVTISTSPKQ